MGTLDNWGQRILGMYSNESSQDGEWIERSDIGGKTKEAGTHNLRGEKA
jgi:hypothetical protein